MSDDYDFDPLPIVPTRTLTATFTRLEALPSMRMDDMTSDMFQPRKPGLIRRLLARMEAWLWGRMEWLCIVGVICLIVLVTCSGCQHHKQPATGDRTGSELATASVAAIVRGDAKVAEALPLVTAEKPRTLLESSRMDFAEAIKTGGESIDAAKEIEAALAKEREASKKARQANIDRLNGIGLWLAIAGGVMIGLGLIAFRHVAIVAEIGAGLLISAGICWGMAWVYGNLWWMLGIGFAGAAVYCGYLFWTPLKNWTKKQQKTISGRPRV